jgi:hypothetical protein
MNDFITGKIKPQENKEATLFEDKKNRKSAPLKFSSEASVVFDAGLELCRYYHSQPKANVNASFYEIREHFQGRNKGGTNENKIIRQKYNELIWILRYKLKILSKKIEPKVYKYGFLLE